MVVADGTARRQPHPHGGSRLGTIPGIQNDVFVDDDAPLVRRDIAAVESAADAGVEHFVGRGRGTKIDQVAGQLQHGEFVKWQVVVEGLNHPLAKGPHLPFIVEVDAVGVGIASVVEPVPSPVFPPGRTREQGIDIRLVGVGAGVSHECFHSHGIGGKAGEIERHATGERAAVSLDSRLEPRRFEPGQDEAVDLVPHPALVGHHRWLRLHGRNERPVRLVRGPSRNPFREQLLLLSRDLFLRGRRRHHLFGIIRIDAV